MLRTISRLYIFSYLLLLVSCGLQDSITVPYSNPQLSYSGRIDTAKIEGAELYWSGTSIKINFKGESFQALVEDESGDNYYNVLMLLRSLKACSSRFLKVNSPSRIHFLGS